jgi:hypothetical protein
MAVPKSARDSFAAVVYKPPQGKSRRAIITSRSDAWF